MNYIFPVIGFAVTMVATGCLWLLMAWRPERWAKWVAQENSFWVGKGVISSALAARMQRWETGSALKWLLAATTLAALLGLMLTCSVLAQAIRLENRKVPRSYNPAMFQKPPTRPATNRPSTNHPPVKATPSNAMNKNARP